jgi:SAM-dependent methyltransferase
VVRCRSCRKPLDRLIIDFGEMPLANGFLHAIDLAEPEQRFPLRVWVCEGCWLMQCQDVVAPDAIFRQYAYFSSYSRSWLSHAEDYCNLVTERFALSRGSLVIEVASNDGYLLRNFVERGIPCLGIEPAQNVSAVARAAGVPTRSVFLDAATAQEIVAETGPANLVIANNVLAHVPAINGFAAGLKRLLRPDGVLTLEFPHLMRLIEGTQFDTIYHEHFSYLSLRSVESLFERHGLKVFDAELLPTHGGSLRLYVQPEEAPVRWPETARFHAVRAAEKHAGVATAAYYDGFAGRVVERVGALRRFLADARARGQTVVAYGAAAKGNTLLNACGVGRGDIAYAVDRNPHKQGRFLPGTHLPIFAPERVFETRPAFLLILPWNIAEEITEKMRGVLTWGGKFVSAIPELRIFPE